ncbi:MAG TPA: hypothetical protein VMY37_33900 [Thermoguttaceae bacterium]|nr:hypothetical protein [Thermoguttaceae bacterium]
MTEPKTVQPLGERVKSLLATIGRLLPTPPCVAVLLGVFVVIVYLAMLCFGTAEARTFTADVFDALAWPVVTLLILLLFHRPLTDLIGRAKSVEMGGVRIELRDLFRKLEEQTAPLLEEAVRQSRSLRLDGMLLEMDVARSPKQAILDAWSVVERSLRDLVWLKSHTQPPRTFKGLGTRVREEKLLPEDLSNAVDTLRRIFRATRNAGESEVPQPYADDYQRRVSLIVSAVNAEIQNARDSHGDGLR